MESSLARASAAAFVALLLAGAAACGSSGEGANGANGATRATGTSNAEGASGSRGAGEAAAPGVAGMSATRSQDGAAASGPPWTARTQGGRYLVTIRPEHGALRIGALDPWLVQITSATGAPVQPLQLRFDGGMPQHGHGFESKPRVTDDLGGGLIRVDGVRFQMSGAWTIRVDVGAAEGTDYAVFTLEVGP